MSKMLQKVERLQAKSLQKTQDLQQSKQNTWNTIQQDYPEIAGFITDFNDVFGTDDENKVKKLKAVGVKIKDKVILNTKGWQKPRDLSIKLENKRFYKRT